MMIRNDLFNLVLPDIETVSRGFENSEVSTGISPLDGVDPLCKCLPGYIKARLCQDMMVVIPLNEPLDLSGFHIFRDFGEFVSIAGFAGGHKVKDIVSAACGAGQIVIDAEGTHFERFSAEKADAMLTLIEVMAVDFDVFSDHDASHLLWIAFLDMKKGRSVLQP